MLALSRYRFWTVFSLNYDANFNTNLPEQLYNTQTEVGNGIRASRDFRAGEFVCIYRGDDISSDDAAKREEEYAKVRRNTEFIRASGTTEK